MPLTTVALLTFIGLVALFVVYQTFSLSVARRRLAMFEAKYALLSKAASNKSSGAQRATIKGQIAEQVAPLLPGFPFRASDFKFLGGAPIDFIAYVGLTEAMEGLGGIEEVVIGDIKQGGSRLSPHQRLIRDAVAQGRVRWQTIHIDQDFKVRSR